MSTGNVNDLNSETVSKLLIALEKNGSAEEKAETVRETLICLRCLLENNSNLGLWEQLSENVGKIFEVCFCTSVKLNAKELLDHNISILEQIIEVNKNLTNQICGYLLDPCLNALCVYGNSSDYDLLLRLANLSCSLCQKTSRMKRNEIVPTIIDSLNALSNLVFSCGDYEIQAAIMEIIARCNSSIPSMSAQGSNCTLHLFSCSEKFAEEFQKYSFVNFEGDCRLFLNALNESLGEERQVFSIPCKCVVLDNTILNKPKDPNYRSFWVDFNLGRKQISFYHEPSENGWTINRVSFDEVVKVVSNNSICGTKTSKKKVETVKVEFKIDCKDDGLLTVKILKIYSCQYIFQSFHTVLENLFTDIYECKVDFSSKYEIELPHNQPVGSISSPPFNILTVHKELEKSPSRLDEYRLQYSEFDMNRGGSDFTFTKISDKHCKNKSEPFCQSKSKVESIISNSQESQKDEIADTSKNTSSYFESKGSRNLNKEENQPKSHAVKNNNDTASRKRTKSYLHKRTYSESVMDEYLKQPDESCNIKDIPVKMKRLYSFENDNSNALSLQEESEPFDESDKKIPSGNEKSDLIFATENVTCRKVSNKKNPFRLFSDGKSSDESEKFIDAVKNSSSVISNKEDYGSEASDKEHGSTESLQLGARFARDVFKDDSFFNTTKKNHAISTYSKKKNRRLSIKKLPSLSPCTSDSDYKPASCKDTDPDYKPSTCTGTVAKLGIKRVLRGKNKLTNTRDSIEQTKSKKSKAFSNTVGFREVKDSKTKNLPKNPKKYDLRFNTHKSQTHTSTRLLEQDNFPSELNNIFLLKKGGSSFVDTIDISKTVDPIRNEIKCKDNDIEAIQPVEPDCVPRKIISEPGCQIIDKDFNADGLDKARDSNETYPDELKIGNISNCGSFKLEKGIASNTWNVVDKISLEIHNESLVQDGSLLQTPLKIDEMLALSKTNESSLQNSIRACLIQSQKERASNFTNYDLQLQTSRNYILESCEKLQSNCRDLETLKGILNETLNTQQDLIAKIQTEMAVLEKAKEGLFFKESEVKNSETFSIMKIFQGVGTYIRKLLFTSHRQNALHPHP